MQENNSKMNIKKMLKKGNQKFKSFLGFMETIKEYGVQVVSVFKYIGENAAVFLLGILVWPFILIKNFILSLFKTGKNLWEQINSSFYKTLGILVAIFCVFTTLIIVLSIIFHYNPGFINTLNSKFILTNNNYNPETLDTLNQLVTQGKVISAGEVYNHVLEYYNTLITILLALLGVFGFISWVSIQSKIKHETELSVDSKFENKDFQCRLEKEVEKVAVVVAQATAKKILDDDEYISKIADNNAVKIIESILNSKEFLNEIKEIIQTNKDDENVELKPLDGVEDGDEI